MTDRSRIDAELDGVRLSPDGSRLILLLHDATGEKVSLSLPTRCMNAMLTAAPQPASAGNSHAVETWDMAPAGNGRDMILTLCTTDGMVMSFTIKSWQAEGMATVVTYGSPRGGANRTLH